MVNDGRNNELNIDKDKLSLSLRLQHLIIALLLFAIFYTLTNAYSAIVFDSYPQRIHSLAITIDNKIPFISTMIIPYSWSMIVFIASFFIVRTARQLSVLSARLIVATLLACLVFYLYPARFSFVRPLTTDWTAFGYQFLNATDKPFNQLPSLHVTYALLLAVSLWNVISHNHKWQLVAYRFALLVVCALITVSTVLTYQHHLLDIVGGFILASIVLVIVHNLQSALVLKYLTVGISGFLLIAIVSFFIDKYSAINYVGIVLACYWLTSFMLLSGLYQVNNIKINQGYFRKNSVGKLTLSTWFAFAPILLAYKIMSHLGQLYSANKQSKTVTSTLWHSLNNEVLVSASARLSSAKFINRFLPMALSKEVGQLIVVDVAAEINSHVLKINTAIDKVYDQTVSTHYLYLPLLDLQPFSRADVPLLVALFEQIDQLIYQNELSRASADTQATLINFHCVMGLSRSIAMQVLYLVYCDKLSVNTYKTWVNQHYPHAHLSEIYLPKSVVKAMASAKI
ncbi:MAG: phosphatase PAP2 family protein [Psychrobacter sp.]|nr:phosphatase PAP2 family protein [Psychrobacter sp.]